MAEVLVVSSKVKKFIKECGCNTSGETIQVLSAAIEKLCKRGAEAAQSDGRKTVMARDIIIDHL